MAATTSQRFTAWLFRNHRWFGILPCLFVIMWGSSGVLHPIMSRLSPQAVASSPPSQSIRLHEALEPREILQNAGVESVSAFRVVEMEGESYYQLTSSRLSPLTGEGQDNQRRYFNVNTGMELMDGDVHYAQQLARHFTGDTTSEIISTSLIENFDDDYLSVNRLLPVYRVDFARPDGLRIYIETNPGRAATLVDNTKASLSSIFQWMHTWTFMGSADTLRKMAITVLLSATLLSALSGVWIYAFMWKHHTLSNGHASLRRWHRSVGISVALTTILFVCSGIWHLFGSEPRDVPAPLATRISASSLSLPETVRHQSFGSINVVQVAGRSYYQAAKPLQNPQNSSAMTEHAEHEGHHASSKKQNEQRSVLARTLYIAVDSGESLDDAERTHAISLATAYSGMDQSKMAEVSYITKFTDEYGFVNKRLPVWRVEFATPDHAAFYVETSSGALAAAVRDADRYEGYSFAFLHKYHWLDFAGKNVRDIVNAMFGLGAVLVATLGLWMFVRRYTCKFDNRRNT